MDVLQQAQKEAAYITEIRRRIHQNPEVGFEEFETTALIREELFKYQVEIQDLPIETGAVGLIKGEKPGPGKVIALRADIDALPIQEATGLPYASRRPGYMHACGHDGHTATLLGVAKMLSSLRSQFSGAVKLIFQPAEELLYGASSIIEAGCMENPKPDFILSLHGGVEVPVGKVGVFPGPFMASADKFILKVKGVGGHAAYPHRCKDPVLAAAQVLVALQTVASRELDPVDKFVLSVCQFNAGSAFNIIPNEAVLTGSVRCHDKAVRESIKERVERIAGGITQALGCAYELEYIFGIPAVSNNSKITNDFAQSARKALGAENVVELERPLMGSEDFAYYLEKVPGCMFRLGLDDGKPISGHHPMYDFRDQALPVGMAAIVQFVLDQSR